MGMVLRFNPRPIRHAPATPGGTSGQVVLFTGVRYDRSPVTTATQASRRKRKG